MSDKSAASQSVGLIFSHRV